MKLCSLYGESFFCLFACFETWALAVSPYATLYSPCSLGRPYVTRVFLPQLSKSTPHDSLDSSYLRAQIGRDNCNSEINYSARHRHTEQFNTELSWFHLKNLSETGREQLCKLSSLSVFLYAPPPKFLILSKIKLLWKSSPVLEQVFITILQQTLVNQPLSFQSQHAYYLHLVLIFYVGRVSMYASSWHTWRYIHTLTGHTYSHRSHV